MKRKADFNEDKQPSKRHQPPSSIRSAFRENLFDESTLTSYRNSYRTSSPYPHAVVDCLIQDKLLRSVQNEIKTHIHFTLKETDIYRIHQSGDLANLSTLDADSLKHLPNLVTLRDALYSPDFPRIGQRSHRRGQIVGKQDGYGCECITRLEAIFYVMMM